MNLKSESNMDKLKGRIVTDVYYSDDKEHMLIQTMDGLTLSIYTINGVFCVEDIYKS